MKEQFVSKRFSAASKAIVVKANEIITEYTAQGFTLTLRQLYYQFVARGILPNKQSEYKRLGSIINDARLAGLIDWDAIEDRTRFLRAYQTWEEPQDPIANAARRYRRDWWEGQKWRPEIWIEKDALIGVIEPACNEFQVPYFACRGYSSQSEQYRASKRLAGYEKDGYTPMVFHLGDHDPSGLDMSRDNDARLQVFLTEIGTAFQFKRLALNMAQVRQYNPPPNPAKETDSRSGEYMREHGNNSWELDALDPRVIHTLLVRNIRHLINQPQWDIVQQQEQSERAQLERVVARWERVLTVIR